ncbi:MAG: hypothetical protein WD595_06650 [Waddliaceae bacterium]
MATYQSDPNLILKCRAVNAQLIDLETIDAVAKISIQNGRLKE